MEVRKKEIVRITSEGLHLLTTMNFSSLADIGGFYGKDVFFTSPDDFAGDIQYLFQILGNLGAHPRCKNLDSDISVIILANRIVLSLERGKTINPFISDFEKKLNQDNSPYRRMTIITESHLMWNIENRIVLTEDTVIEGIMKEYKVSVKNKNQMDLFK